MHQQGGQFPPCHAVLRAYITMTRLIRLVTVPFLLISSLCSLSDTFKVVWMFMKLFQIDYTKESIPGRGYLLKAMQQCWLKPALFGDKMHLFPWQENHHVTRTGIFKGFSYSGQGWEREIVVLVCMHLFPY